MHGQRCVHANITSFASAMKLATLPGTNRSPFTTLALSWWLSACVPELDPPPSADPRIANTIAGIQNLDGVTNVHIIGSAANQPVVRVHTTASSDLSATRSNAQQIADVMWAQTWSEGANARSGAALVVVDSAPSPQMYKFCSWKMSANSRRPFVTTGAAVLLLLSALTGIVAWRQR